MSAWGAPGDISTYAGGYRGDGRQAIHAILDSVRDVVVDKEGNVYLSESGGPTVRKISPSGVISTIAGSPGRPGYSGDGGPATEARLRSPAGLVVDDAGSLYIADETGHRIRKVEPNGTISTIAGTGTIGSTGDGGPATDATLSHPMGLAFDDAGNLYVADYQADRIRMIDPSGTITTVAGTGSSGFSGDGGPATAAKLSYPMDVAIDAQGNLYIADGGNYRIRKVAADTGIITTIAGNGTWAYCADSEDPLKACFGQTTGIVTSPGGSLFIADAFNAVIYELTAKGRLERYAGDGVVGSRGDGGPALKASFNSPWGIDFARGTLFIADSSGNRVRSVADNVAGTVAGRGGFFCCDGMRAVRASLDNPRGGTLDKDGNLYIADTYNHRVRVVRASGVIETIAGTGKRGYAGDGGPATNARLHSPSDVAVDRFGNVFISDHWNASIRKIDTNGIITTIAGGKFGYSGDGGAATSARLRYPNGVDVDRRGNIYIADSGNHRIRVIKPSGSITTVAGGGRQELGDGGPARKASLEYPIDVDIVGSTMYIADSANSRIRTVNAEGVIRTIAGSEQLHGFFGDGGPATAAGLNFPTGIAVDGGGNIYIADYGNHRVRKIDPSGMISTFAGSKYLQNHWSDRLWIGTEGEGGYGGDGGPATKANLKYPWSVILSPDGGVYIVEEGNARVRFVEDPI